MTSFDPNFDPNVEMTLEFARIAREPSAVDRLRVLEALRTRLGTGAPGAPSHEAAGGARPGPLPPNAALPHAAPRVHAALGQLIAVGAVTGVIGYFVGSSFNPALITAPPAPIATTESAASPPAPPPSLPSRVAPEPATLSTPEPTATGVDATRRASLPTPPTQRAHARRATPTAQSKGPQFLEAVRLVQRAQRAIDGGEPLLAMALLDELDARFPQELLNEERQATRVLALCESGQTDSAERAAKALATQNPNSIYAARIEKSCIGWSQRAPTRR